MISRLENLKWLYNHVHPRPEKLVALPQKVSLVALLLLKQLQRQKPSQLQLHEQHPRLRHALQQARRQPRNHQNLSHLQMFAIQIAMKLYLHASKSALQIVQNFAQRVFKRRLLQNLRRLKAHQRATHVNLHQNVYSKRVESQRRAQQNL